MTVDLRQAHEEALELREQLVEERYATIQAERRRHHDAQKLKEVQQEQQYGDSDAAYAWHGAWHGAWGMGHSMVHGMAYAWQVMAECEELQKKSTQEKRWWEERIVHAMHHHR